MKHMLNRLVAVFGLSIPLAIANPSYLVTHNKTNVQSNAFVAGVIPSSVPTPPNGDSKVHWVLVRILCAGHTIQGRCSALIKMATNTRNPIPLGMVSMDIESGDIIPKQISANGYTLTVNGPGEVTLEKVGPWV
jgi:hypothetical protein